MCFPSCPDQSLYIIQIVKTQRYIDAVTLIMIEFAGLLGQQESAYYKNINFNKQMVRA